MSETPGFSPHAAAKALVDATGYEDALRQRTEGLTTAVWGLVSPGIFLSYALLGASIGTGAAGSSWEFLYGVLWVPWVAAGVAVTALLWRTACLAAPRLQKEGPNRWVVLASFLGAYLVLGGAAVLAVPRVNEPTFALLAVGAAWTVFGAVNIFRCSPTGRRVDTLVGAVLFLSGVVVALTVPGEEVAGYIYATVVASLATGLVPIAGGLWQVARA